MRKIGRCLRHPLVLGVSVAGALAVLLATSTSRGDPPAAAPGTGESEVEIIREVTAATDKALDYLERVQIAFG
jgi:hypothetical protein